MWRRATHWRLDSFNDVPVHFLGELCIVRVYKAHTPTHSSSSSWTLPGTFDAAVAGCFVRSVSLADLCGRLKQFTGKSGLSSNQPFSIVFLCSFFWKYFGYNTNVPILEEID